MGVTPLILGFGVAAAAISGRAVKLGWNKFMSGKGGYAFGQKYYEGGFQLVMNKREAALILGCRQSADAKRIMERYRILMKLNHPDLGGSPFVAQKINEAKGMLIASKKKE